MSVTVEKVTDSPQLGEGPHWDSSEQALYYVDIVSKIIFRYVPETGSRTSSTLDESPHFIIPISDKPRHFAVSLGRRVVELRWDGQQDTAQVVRTVCQLDQDKPRNLINDAKVDPRERIFTGTMGTMEPPSIEIDQQKGSIYRIDNDGTPHKLDEGINLSNGIAFDVKEKAFYYVDTLEHGIRRYDYDIETGDISNPRIIFDLKEHGIAVGMADGMTIDTDGNLWVAIFNESQVINVDPRTGTLIRSIKIPTNQVTSATFGGPDLSDLYVTTGCMEFAVFGVEPDRTPLAGSVFKVTGLGVKGHPNLSVKWN